MSDGGKSPALPPGSAEDIAVLAAFLVSSGIGLPYQPPSYGPFRFLDAARRTLRILESGGVHNSALVNVRQQIDAALFAPIENMDFAELLESLALEMADGLRTMGAGPGPDLDANSGSASGSASDSNSGFEETVA
ncbi:MULTISPECIES: DUF6092 family protein [Streptomyces]|uniref:DUF6092 family protein n=1 Tax=Streptomyces TaxID=1883 RepID=UPI001E4FE64D|nr:MULTISPECIES: DUF6092 family protein [Streptomyces]UFQ18720.1 DUF6092 family protein [Streptomyces huasconensis]WCL88337.1 DUF6092 family protein [Streptomyces sp. JCM 35825]